MMYSKKSDGDVPTSMTSFTVKEELLLDSIMKKIYITFLRIFFTVCFLSLGIFSMPAQTSGRHLAEAEDAKNNGFDLQEDSAASGGKYIQMKGNGSLLWNISADTSSWYEITVRYRAFGSDKEETIIRNGYRYAVGFGRSEHWNKFSTRTYLHVGINEIELQNTGSGIDIDWLEIAPVVIKPTVKPLHNIVYREVPRDLFFKINRFGHRITSVNCGEQNFRYEVSEFPGNEDAVMLKIPAEEILKLKNGNNKLHIHFDTTLSEEVSVQILDSRTPVGLTIIAPDIDHGASVLMILPTNKILLIDCGKNRVRDSILIPLLHRLGIQKIDYFILTHYHDDHDSGDRGEKIKNLFCVLQCWDYRSFHTGDEFELEGTRVKILNSYEDGDQENTRSLSFRMEYHGFVYVDGADTYDTNQKKIMKRFPNDIEADVFHANHHFHGSIDGEYLRLMNPEIVLLQAQGALYARSAYMDVFKKEVEEYLIGHHKRYIEDLPALEVGTVVVRVISKDSWTYETSKTVTDTIPYVFK